MMSVKPQPGADKSGRLPYERPTLRFYGTLSALTRGPGSGKDEAGGSTSGNMRPTGSSDRAIKSDIVKVDTHPSGFGLYLFDYKPQFQASCGHGRQFGVMADEVEQVMPEAVSVHIDGYKMVDYSMLGIYRGEC